jgi:thiamine pyridinylase
MTRKTSKVRRDLAAMAARGLILAICIAAFVTFIPASAATDTPTSGGGSRRLRVVLYPFIPDYEGFLRQITERFSASAEGKGIEIEFVDLTNGYYDPSSNKFVGATQADVYELDSVLFNDFVDSSKIRPLPQALRAKEGEFLATAQRRSFVDGTLYGYPHWVCANFLFYRSGDTAVANARTLADLEHVLTSQDKSRELLLGDFKGTSTLGEFYLMSLFDRYGNWSEVKNHLLGLEQSQVNDIVRLAALCRQGYCHNEARHEATGSYGREFARGSGRVLVGYSEILYYVAAEKQLCGQADACVSPDVLDAGLVPMDDRGVTPMVWVDSFVLSASCKGQCEQDAVSFLRFVNSEETQRWALAGSPPRYLMPARASLYSDPSVLKAARLYPKLRSLVESAEAPSAPNLNKKLRDDGKTIDGTLPEPAEP